MRVTNVLVIIFYTFILSLVGGFLIAISLNLIQLPDLTYLLKLVYQTGNLRIQLGIVGLALALISISFANLTLGRIQREKTIAFTTSGGQVSISLAAIEDFIRRLTQNLPEVKELKSDVSASKRGIEIKLRTTLWSDVNIPDATSKIQEIIRSRVQEILGIEETVNIKIHVTKIIPRQGQGPVKEETQEQVPTPPFREYKIER
jgi:uncharacterized alkaline shock family protein YloU